MFAHIRAISTEIAALQSLAALAVGTLLTYVIAILPVFVGAVMVATVIHDRFVAVHDNPARHVRGMLVIEALLIALPEEEAYGSLCVEAYRTIQELDDLYFQRGRSDERRRRIRLLETLPTKFSLTVAGAAKYNLFGWCHELRLRFTHMVLSCTGLFTCRAPEDDNATALLDDSTEFGDARKTCLKYMIKLRQEIRQERQEYREDITTYRDEMKKKDELIASLQARLN